MVVGRKLRPRVRYSSVAMAATPVLGMAVWWLLLPRSRRLPPLEVWTHLSPRLLQCGDTQRGTPHRRGSGNFRAALSLCVGPSGGRCLQLSLVIR